MDDAGVFTKEAGSRFQGKAVLDEGNTAVLQALKESGNLLKVALSTFCVQSWLEREENLIPQFFVA